ncbi:MAG: hypothetical protein JHD16_16655, partial [Solirubrobacteraceae bacterium]|nr:hypothetical protein [Solirubrobacteraceae bacterium]
EELHARGINVIAVTIPPTGGAWVATYGDFWMGDDRRAVNSWIRNTGNRHVPGVASTTRYPDGFWDLSKAVQDANDVRQLPSLVTWDNVHPNSAGYKKFIDDTATAGKLGLLRGRTCS